MFIFFKKPDVNDMLKAVVKKVVWVSGYTMPNGRYVRAHQTTVNASTDHDDHKVASGQGKGYQVHAHKHLSKQAEHNALPVEQQSNNILHLATKMQKKASTTSDINTLKKKIIEGKKPTAGEWKSLLGAKHAKIDSVIKEITDAGKFDFYSKLATDYAKNNGDAKDVIEEVKPKPVEKIDEKPANESSNDQANKKNEALQSAIDHLEEDSKQSDLPEKEKAEDKELIAELKDASEPVKKESTRHAAALSEIASLPSGNYKKQAHSELSSHSEWDSWSDKEKHSKVMALYKEKQSVATAASNVVKFKKTIKDGGIPSPAQMSAVMAMSDEKRSTLLSSLADEVGGADKLKEILAKADEKAKKNGIVYDKKQDETSPVTSPVESADESTVSADEGPKYGDTKEGSDGTLVFKDGRWHKQGEEQKDVTSDTVVEPAQEAVADTEKEPDTQDQGVSGQSNALEIKQFTHSKKGHEVYAVPLPKKLNNNDYKDVAAIAKQLGGFFSSFKKDGAIVGFHFKYKADAETFAQNAGLLINGDVEHAVAESVPSKNIKVAVAAIDKVAKYLPNSDGTAATWGTQVDGGMVDVSPNGDVIISVSKHDKSLGIKNAHLDTMYEFKVIELMPHLSGDGKAWIEKVLKKQIDKMSDTVADVESSESVGKPVNQKIQPGEVQETQEASINDQIKDAGSQSVAADVAEAYFAKHGESVETYDAVLTALDMQGYGKLANDFYEAMPESIKALSSMEPAGKGKSAQAPVGTEASIDGEKYTKTADGEWTKAVNGLKSELTGNVPAALELISGHMPEEAWFNAKSDNHKDSVVEIASENGVPMNVALDKLYPAGEHGPNEGDTKYLNGVTYILQNGRWHKMGEDTKETEVPNAPGSLSELKIPKDMTEGERGKLKATLSSLAANHANLSVSVGKYKITIKDQSAGWKQTFYNPSMYTTIGSEKQYQLLQFLLSGKSLAGGSVNEKIAQAMDKAGYPIAELKGKKPKKKPVEQKIVFNAKKVYKENPEVKNLTLADVLGHDGESIDSWTKDGGKMGSNEGGLYTDGTGQQWYCKFPKTDDHVKNEILASKLYEALGMKVATVKEINLNGKMGIASKIIDGLKIDKKALKKSNDMLNGFAADCWLGNWDVVGMNYDNALIDQSGSVYRIDPGGALLYRAQGGPKGDDFGRYVTELDTLLDASKNPQSAAIFGDMTHDQLNESVKNVLLLKDSAIEKLCTVYGPGSSADRGNLAKKLIARKNDLAKKFPEAAKEAMPKMTYQLKDAPNFKEWNGPGQGLSSKKHLNDQNQDLADQMHALASEKKLDELNGFEFQPISYENGEPVGSKQPIELHKSKHVVNYWKDLINDLKTPVMSIDHLKDVVISTVGGIFGKMVSMVDDVEKLTEAAVKIGRYALLGAIDGDPFAGWGVKELSQKSGAINAQDVYNETHKKWKTLSNLEQEAVKQYTGSGYSSMNNPMTGIGSHSNTDYAIAGFEKMSVPLKPGTVLSRKFSFGSSADLEKFLSSEGGIIKDFGMVSSSLDSNVWSGSVHLRIVCGEGVKAAYVAPNPSGGGGAISVHPGEDEVVFPYGTKFFIRKVHKKGSSFTDEHGSWGNYSGDVVELVALPNT